MKSSALSSMPLDLIVLGGVVEFVVIALAFMSVISSRAAGTNQKSNAVIWRRAGYARAERRSCAIKGNREDAKTRKQPRRISRDLLRGCLRGLRVFAVLWGLFTRQDRADPTRSTACATCGGAFPYAAAPGGGRRPAGRGVTGAGRRSARADPSALATPAAAPRSRPAIRAPA